MIRLKEIQKRLSEIQNELEQEGADLTALETEVASLTEERALLLANVEKRKNLLDTVAAATNATVIKNFKPEEKSVDSDINQIHYKNAFLKNLLGEELSVEERAAFIHTTENTSQVIPADLQNKIYSTMEESHPILADVQILRTGTVFSITKHTSIKAGDAKVVGEGEANDDEENTFVNVVLSGKDFSKHVDFSYRLGKMAIPAFEDYLVKEISSRIGAAMAKDIITQIKTDLAATNKINAATPGKLELKDVLNGLKVLKETGRVYVYANNSTFYGDIAQLEGALGLISFIPNYQEAISGQLFGKGIKEEDALDDGEILILDPEQFIFNVVQDIMLERDKDIKKHVHTISGFAIAGGTMTNDRAGSLVTVGVTV